MYDSKLFKNAAAASAGLIVFPSMVLHLDVGRDKSIASLEQAMLADQYIFLASQKK